MTSFIPQAWIKRMVEQLKLDWRRWAEINHAVAANEPGAGKDRHGNITPPGWKDTLWNRLRYKP